MDEKWNMKPGFGMGTLNLGMSVDDFPNAVYPIYGQPEAINEPQSRGLNQEAIDFLKSIDPNTDWEATAKEVEEVSSNHPDEVFRSYTYLFADGLTIEVLDQKLVSINCGYENKAVRVDGFPVLIEEAETSVKELIQRYGQPLFDGNDILYFPEPKMWVSGFYHKSKSGRTAFGPRSNSSGEQPAVSIFSLDLEDPIEGFDFSPFAGG